MEVVVGTKKLSSFLSGHYNKVLVDAGTLTWGEDPIWPISFKGLKPPTRQEKSSRFFFCELKAIWREDPLTPHGDIEGCTGASVVGEEYILHQPGKKSRITPPTKFPPPKTTNTWNPPKS